MLLHMVDTEVLERVGGALERAPEPLRRWSLGLRLRIWTEIWHRDVEAELTRRGYGLAPIAA